MARELNNQSRCICERNQSGERNSNGNWRTLSRIEQNTK
jgi:hypothetical protein